MGALFTRINDFLNEEQTIQVLYALVLIMALLWLLTGGFNLGRKKPRQYSKKESKKEKEEIRDKARKKL